MTWADYTRAKCFGDGIYLPFAGFLSSVAVALDNKVAFDPVLARRVAPLAKRDTVIIIGEQITIFAISVSTHLQHPYFHSIKFEDYFLGDEDQVIKKLAISRDGATKVNFPELDDALKNANFIDPFVFSIPTEHATEPYPNDSGQKTESLTTVAEMLFAREMYFYSEQLEMDKPKDIFLSHKSADKATVREVALTLSALGFSPWLDEDKMQAGTNLERALHEAFVSSCAAVFFVTPNFVDEKYLAAEIDYAIEQKRDRGDRFAIITLLIPGPDGSFGSVPPMLRKYVWKEVQPHEAIRKIVEALPIKMTNIVWRQ